MRTIKLKLCFQKKASGLEKETFKNIKLANNCMTSRIRPIKQNYYI